MIDACAVDKIDKSGIATIGNLGCLFQNIVSYALGFAGIVLFILLIVGGFKYITSGGDPKAVEGAKKTLTSAIIGLVLILVSYLILVLITNITGVDVTKFNVTLPPGQIQNCSGSCVDLQKQCRDKSGGIIPGTCPGTQFCCSR